MLKNITSVPPICFEVNEHLRSRCQRFLPTPPPILLYVCMCCCHLPPARPYCGVALPPTALPSTSPFIVVFGIWIRRAHLFSNMNRWLSALCVNLVRMLCVCVCVFYSYSFPSSLTSLSFSIISLKCLAQTVTFPAHHSL